MPGHRREGVDRLPEREPAEGRHDVAVADVERADDVRVVDGAELGGEAGGVGRVDAVALDEERLDRDPHAEPGGEVAQLAQPRPLQRVQPVELRRRPGRDDAGMVDHHGGPHGRRQLEHGAGHALVVGEVRLVHQVDREHAVDGVAEAAPGAGGLEPARHVGQDAAAGDELGGEQRQLAVGDAGVLDPGERLVDVGEVGAEAAGGEADARDRGLVRQGLVSGCWGGLSRRGCRGAA